MMRIAEGLFLIVLSSTIAWPATLSLGSGSSVPGGSITIPVSLSSSGTSISAVEWTLSYSSTDIASMQIAAASSLAGAGKQLFCSTPAAGRFVCVVSGLDQNGIPDGVFANAVLTIATNTTSTSSNLSVGAPSASTPNGTAGTINATGSTVTITQGVATLSGLTCSSASISVPGSTSCTVTLSKSAPSGGTVVTLGYAATSATLSVPTSVTVPAGSSQQSFTVQAVSASGSTNATVTANLNGTLLNYTLAVAPASTTVTLSGLTCSPSSITVPGSASCTTTLSGLAPSGGTIVALSYQSTGATMSIPASVTVPAGSRQQSFTAQALTTSGSATVTVSATLNGTTSSYTLSVAPGTTTPVTVSSLQCSPSSLTVPGSTACTVTLSGSAPSSGAIVSLSYQSTGATMWFPASVTVPAGSTQVLFHVQAETAPDISTVTLYATLNGNASSYTLSVAPGTTSAVTVSSLQCSPWRLTAPEWTTCTLTLSRSAASGGLTVPLSYKSPGATMWIPASVTVPAGSTQFLFHVKAESARYSTTATLYARLNGRTSRYTLAVAP